MAVIETGVVSLADLGGGVAEIAMHDAESRNTFSDALIEGVLRCFELVKANADYKVVVLTGYDTYFASGGTKELLLKMARGEIRFNDLDLCRQPLDCELPVIAAMQGHAIGGGFIFGLYSDFLVMSLESLYTTNFLRYGFTPGVGATIVTPLKLGCFLANEMLYTARNFRGEEFLQRGAGVPVLPRKEVVPYARRMAAGIAEKPRQSLVLLKQHMTRDLRERLPGVIEQELRMHDLTFRQEVTARIEELFGR